MNSGWGNDTDDAKTSLLQAQMFRAIAITTDFWWIIVWSFRGDFRCLEAIRIRCRKTRKAIASTKSDLEKKKTTPGTRLVDDQEKGA